MLLVLVAMEFSCKFDVPSREVSDRFYMSRFVLVPIVAGGLRCPSGCRPKKNTRSSLCVCESSFGVCLASARVSPYFSLFFPIFPYLVAR